MDAIGWPEESDPPLAARGTMLGNGLLILRITMQWIIPNKYSCGEVTKVTEIEAWLRNAGYGAEDTISTPWT